MFSWLATFYIFLLFYSTYAITTSDTNSTSTNIRCTVSEFQCSDGACIPLSAKCDGVKNCLLHDDELNCQGACENEGFFRCGSGECIHNSWVCDVSPDCADKSDELDCHLKTAPLVEEPCGKNQFRCPGSWCIPESWLCDKDANCLNGEDESEEFCNARTTEAPKACSAEQFECSPGECVMHRWVCDGYADCPNGNDEGDQCGTYRDPCLIEEGYFSCGNNTEHKCLSPEYICDGIPQCPDKNDEGGKCNTTCSTISCSHNCTQTPMGPKCFCSPGFTLSDNGKDCVDVDECQTYGSCSQQCLNTEGSFDCSCLPGYNLVNGTCFATGQDPVIYVSTKNSIRSYNMRTKTGNRITNNLEHVIGVSYDAQEDRVYWTDVKMKQEQIESTPTKGSAGGRKVHLSSGLDVPEDIVIDQASRNLYFSDSGKGHIAVCDLSGTDCKILVKEGQNSKPRGLAIHDRMKLLFYSDWGDKPMIVSVGLDGTQRKEIITTDLVWPNGVAVDQVENRVFWSDAKLDRLESSNLDGSDRMEVLKDLLTQHPFSLSVFEDTLYWSDWTGDMLASCNKFTGKDKKVLVREGDLSIMGITVYHPLMNQGVPNPCAGHPCSHLCLPKPTTFSSSPHFTCACPDGMELKKDGLTCHEPHFNSLVISVEGRIYRVEPHTIGNTGFDLIRGIPGEIDKIQADLTNGNLIVKNDPAVFEVDVHDQKTKIMSMDVDTSQFAYDAISKNIYWIDFRRKSIRVQSVINKSSKPILENLSNPKLLVYCDQVQKLVYLDGVRLVMVDADGSDKTVIYDHVDPTVNLLYYAHQNNSIVLGNTMKNSIYLFDMNTRQMMLLVYGIQNLFDVVVHDGYLFWTQLRSSELFWIKFQRGVRMKDLAWMSISDIVGQYDAVKVSVSSNKTTDFSGMPKPCLSAGCSQLCFSKNFKAECSCEFGHVLDSDGKTCKPGCAKDLFSCGDSEGVEMCLDTSLVCDGSSDCLNGHDEANCTQVCDLNTHYLCDNSECLAGTEHRCDFDEDCMDGSDEKDCKPPTCDQDAGYFLCTDGKKCALQQFKCDGFNDCFDGSDEFNCTIPCLPNFFSCPSGGGCYKESWKCDGRMDCPGGEDEEGCETPSCSADMFLCDNGQCLQYSMVCDKQADCEDGSDEVQSLCKVDPSMDEAPICYDGFICDDICQPLSVRCNGTSECTDDTDEIDCHNICTDTQNFFQCKDMKKCLPLNWVCDGENDCVDASDEQECNQDPDIETRCHPDQYRCSNGECLSLELVCDGYKHCADGSDESSEKCQVCDVNNGNCSHKCYPTPQGAVCSCFDGFKEVWESNHLTCVDIDECLSPSSCPQLCNNTKGSYKCTCTPGFVTEKGGDYCRAEGEDFKLLFLSKYAIKAILPYKKDHRLLSDFTAPIQTVAVNQQDQEIFASLPTQGVIMKVKVEGLLTDNPRTNNSASAEPYLVNVGRVHVMAFDWVTKNLYFATKSSNKIHVCTTKLLCTIILEVKNNYISGLDLDPLRGRLFVASYSSSMLFGGHDGEIATYSLDGKSIKGIQHRISGHKLSEPVGLTVDIHKQRVQWIDRSNGVVFCSDYDGKLVKPVTIFTSYQTSMANFENTLFWINPERKKISSYNIKTQESPNTLVHHVPENSHSIVAIQEQIQPKIVNPCARSQCLHLCLLAAEGDFSCACANGFKPAEGNSSHCELIAQHPSPYPVPSEPEKTKEGPKKTPLASDNTGLIAGLITFLLLVLLGIGLTYVWFKTRNKKQPSDAIAFTNSTYNNNDSQMTEKESQVVMRRGAILSCDNPMFVDSPEATPGSGRFGFLKFGNTTEPTISASPSMDFSSIITVSKGAPTPDQNIKKQRIASESISYEDVTDFSASFGNDKERLLD